ncbi:unnamed protein product [Caenorhabditis angaria]|uniref:Uncharacterized protein n=1 Tax=Caenorhabditis angaria TaxID=860376 RepID=A0A9P1IPD9_9PELO|nr:unnamed protein product [Caenorhabditis angaria]
MSASLAQSEFGNQTHFQIQIGSLISEFEVVYTNCDSQQTNCGWQIKSEKHQKCLSRRRAYYSSLLIDYEQIFARKSRDLLEKYVNNLEIGEFPKAKYFRITGEDVYDIINLKHINPVLKLIGKLPTISKHRFSIDKSSEENLQFDVFIDETSKSKMITIDIIYNTTTGYYEVTLEQQRKYSSDDSKLQWFTSAFIDYREIYRKIVEELMRRFENAIETKEMREDDIFSIKNVNISELGYYTAFIPIRVFDNYYEENNKFSIDDKKLVEFSFELKNNKFYLISDKENSIKYFEYIYAEKAEVLMDDYRNVLLAEKLELKKIFSENFKLYICGRGSLNLTQFEKQLEKMGNVVDFVNPINGDIDLLRNRKSRFLAKFNFDLRKYELTLEYRCQDEDFSKSKDWEKCGNLQRGRNF